MSFIHYQVFQTVYINKSLIVQFLLFFSVLKVPQGTQTNKVKIGVFTS